MPKKGKASLPDHSTTAAYSEEEWLPRGKPLVRSYESALCNTVVRLSFIVCYNAEHVYAVRPGPIPRYPLRMGL